eukprot:TRINITY_DN5496_c0_g1_i4.p1 TRINITY_DN5496_c0_g1~~TRINITY_DN5496_c0_g1_i4.p1  ORF type:complete len:573 (-),score=59.96 TRINITY_DN5496_c0_g1_i4:162-1880(-)
MCIRDRKQVDSQSSRSFSMKMNETKKASKKAKSAKKAALNRLLSKFPQGKKMMLQLSSNNRYSMENLELGQYRQDKNLNNLSTNLNKIISSNFLLLDKFKSYQFGEKVEEKAPQIEEQKKAKYSEYSRRSFRDDDQALFEQAQSLYSSVSNSPSYQQGTTNSQSSSLGSNSNSQMSYLKPSSSSYSLPNTQMYIERKPVQESKALPTSSSYSQMEKKIDTPSIKKEQIPVVNQFQKTEAQKPSIFVQPPKSQYFSQSKTTELAQEYSPKESTRLQLEQEMKELREQMFPKEKKHPSSSTVDPQLSLIQTQKPQETNEFSYATEPGKAQKLREFERMHQDFLSRIDNFQNASKPAAVPSGPLNLFQQINQLEEQTKELQSSVDELQHKVQITEKPQPASLIKEMLGQKDVVIEDKTKASNYSQVLQQTIKEEKISEEQQEEKLVELKNKKEELEKEKQLLSQEQKSNSSEYQIVQVELQVTTQNLQVREEEQKQIEEKMEEMQRIWSYIHPDGPSSGQKQQEQDDGREHKVKDQLMKHSLNQINLLEQIAQQVSDKNTGVDQKTMQKLSLIHI